MMRDEQIIAQTKKWINEVVIGCNFCPFAAQVMVQGKEYYHVQASADEKICVDSLLQEMNRLDNEINIETSFLIFPNAFGKFTAYLDGLLLAEKLLARNGYEGIYQLASFHPRYLFAGSSEKDAANFTNRSVYPMFQLLREASIDKALENYNDPQNIPKRNIEFARNKGVAYMQMLREACVKI